MSESPLTHAEFARRANEFLGDKWDTMPKVCADVRPILEDFNADALSLTVSFEASPWMQNPGGTLHGGIIATMFDNAMGSLASIFADGHFTPTLNLDINYLRALPAHGRVFLRATILKPGKFLTISADMWGERGPEKLSATATATYIISEKSLI